jgi:hypothetical protein
MYHEMRRMESLLQHDGRHSQSDSSNLHYGRHFSIHSLSGGVLLIDLLRPHRPWTSNNRVVINGHC